MARPPRGLEFHPATPGRWSDVETLFGERGACGGCWCMVWRLKRQAWEAGKGAGNRRAFRKLIRDGAEPGVLAYVDGRAVGWCAIAPREDYSYFERTRVLKPIDDKPVWSVSCLFVLKGFRRRGLSAELVRAAARLAADRGATIVEGYPALPTMDKMPDAFAWTGLPSIFEKAGFAEVARGSPSRPIYRKRVRGRAPS